MSDELEQDPRSDPSLDLGALTPAERRVLDIALRGVPVKEIAAELVVTEATVATHLSRIYAKLGVRGRTELLARASQTLAGSQGPGAPAATPRRAVVSPWVGIAVAVFGFVAGLLIPLSSVILGPGLVLVALRWGESAFGWARWVVLVVGALLIAEGLLLLSSYRAS